MSKRKQSLRAAARARYLKKAGQGQDAPSAPATPTRHAIALRAAAGDLPLAGEGEAVDTALMRQAQALYEEGVVPVRDIARLAGVCERTFYRHVKKRGWRRRNVCAARDNAVAAANRGRPLTVAKGVSGRFVRRAVAGAPHPAGLGALDPPRDAEGTHACIAAGALSEAAMADAQAEIAARARLRTLDLCERALGDVMRLLAERPGAPEAAPLALRIADAILGEMGRLTTRG